MPSKEENIKIFNDTISKCVKTLYESTDKCIAEQKFYINEPVPETADRFEEPAKVLVTKSSSFDAARKYNNVAVLNFASATNPGGGVTRGSNAQEECLCRCSNLYLALACDEAMDKFYTPHREHLGPLHNDDIIYTPNVTIIKSDAYNGLYRNHNVNVITCAAPNLREKPGNAYNQENSSHKVKISDSALLELHIKRARKILAVAAAHGNDHIILGAFGCGAFKNSPAIVAEAYKRVIPEFLHKFKTIEFAVYCRDTETENYDAFKEALT